MNLTPGTMLSDHLQLERELGAGGMGSVWVARNMALGNAFAVKLLHRISGPNAAQQRARFEREARGLATLDHPNLVKIFDLGVTMDGDPYIVMELLKGEDLAVRLKRSALSLDATVALVTQVTNALQYVHDAGVIHRDIKPANIFLLDRGDEMAVKVVDFGVAKFADGMMEMTKTGQLVGTPFYMSPEQFMTPKAIDHRSDLWSLAVVVYACLTGVLPFNADSLAAVGVKISLGVFEPPRVHRAELPPALDHFMKRALSVKVEDRYASAKELGAAFARAAAAAAMPSVSSPALGHATSSPPSAAAGLSQPTKSMTPMAPEALRVPFGVSAIQHAPSSFVFGETTPAPAPANHPSLAFEATTPAPVVSPATPSSAVSAHTAASAPPPALAPAASPVVPGPSRGVPLWAVGLLGLSLALAGAVGVLLFLRGTTTSSKSSASASAGPVPIDLNRMTVPDLYERSRVESVKLAPGLELENLSYKGVMPDGTFSQAGGETKVYFASKEGACVTVSLSSAGLVATPKKCPPLSAPVPVPKCSAKALRAKYPPGNGAAASFIYTRSGADKPMWMVNVPGVPGATIPDDC